MNFTRNLRLGFTIACCLFGASACTTYRVAKDIRFVGFSEDVSKGKGAGAIEGDDCVFYVMGYSIGGYPNVKRAITNARVGKKSEVGDFFNGKGGGEAGVRYINNLHVDNEFSNFIVANKQCIVVTGEGFK